MMKHVTKRAPLLFNQSRKTAQRTIVRIEEQLHSGAQLRSAIPSIAAVHDARRTTFQQTDNPDRAIEKHGRM
jgi:hypothetical protein